MNNYEDPHYAVTSNLLPLGPNILLITMFSNTISLCSSRNGDTHSYHCALKGSNKTLFIPPCVHQSAIDSGTPVTIVSFFRGCGAQHTQYGHLVGR
jgi:hypothetical protein